MADKISAVFLDRDGVVNKKIEMDYVKKWDEFEFLPDAISAIKLINDKNIPVYLITNQSGIGRGKMTQKALDIVHQKMGGALAKEGAHIDEIFVCPHAPEDNCDCRKPKPGLLLQAKEKYPEIDFKNSWFIGDSQIDVEAGK
ncbi:phosphatase, partial [candidate division WOR-1 bacterium RIFOXYA12_FULL_36_13]